MDLFLMIHTETGRHVQDNEGRPLVVEAWTPRQALDWLLDHWAGLLQTIAHPNPDNPGIRPVRLGTPREAVDHANQ